MKKIFIAMVCLMTMIVFNSCGNIESEAKCNMEALMKDAAKNPSTLEITDVKTVFKTDSCVVLTFKASGQNGFGGYSKSKYAYLYSIYKFNKIGTKKMHSIINISNGENIENAIWSKIKRDIEERSKDSAQATILAYNILAGENVDTNEPIINDLK